MNKTVQKCFVLSIFILFAFYFLFMFLSYENISVLEITNTKAKFLFSFYAENMRGHLFAGFLGLGGFLLSLKTFIIVNMKENLYEDPTYKDSWKKNKKYNEKTLYEPLKELSDILYFAIFSCIIASISQMTLGFIKHDIFALVCIYLCILSTVLLIKSLIIIKENLDTWFEYLD